MKKVLLTALVAVLGLGASDAFAQISQGTLSVGGAVSFTTEKEDGDDEAYKFFELSPTVGYFLADDLELGVELTLARGAYDKNITSGYGFGPYLRKYFSMGETTYFYGQAGISVGGGKVKFDGDEAATISALEVGIKPGFMFRPTDRIGIDLTAGFLGYSSYKENWDLNSMDEETSKFGLTLDMRNVSLGVRLFF